MKRKPSGRRGIGWRKAIAIGGIGAGAYFGGGELAKNYPHMAPEKLQPIVRKAGEAYTKINAKARKEVDEFIKKYGREIVLRVLGATGGAWTVSQLASSRKRKLRRKEGGKAQSFELDEETHDEGIRGRTRNLLVAGGAIGGLASPAAGISVAAARAMYNAWQTMSPEQRRSAVNKMKGLAARKKRKKNGSKDTEQSD